MHALAWCPRIGNRETLTSDSQCMLLFARRLAPVRRIVLRRSSLFFVPSRSFLQMGCTSSQPKPDAAAAAEKQRKRDAANAAMNAPKLNPADFMLQKLKGQTIVREPGSIRGQQFIIEECEDCSIFLMDNSATVSIDDCKNCNIFVGPCESSVFVRTSSHLKLVIAAQQLRTRECKDLDILLYVSAGQPVIEATTGVRLGCFEFNYFGLAEQFAAAGLNPWYSEWSNVHDFTASSGGGGGAASWSFIQPPMIKGTELLPLALQAEEVSGGKVSVLPSGFVTPQTWGNRPLPFASNAPRMLVLLAEGSHAVGFEMLDQTLGASIAAQQVCLIRSRCVALAGKPASAKAAAVLVGEARKSQSAFVSAVTAAPPANGPKPSVLGFELALQPDHSAEVIAALQTLAAKTGAKSMYLSGTSDAESKGPLEAFFENAPIM